VTVAVAKALREAGIEIPFPQRDLHIRSFDAPPAQALPESAIRATPDEDLQEHSSFRKQDG
jgi:small-conductance mechanosensitive channel